MLVKQEIKSQLAKLLATEDLIVENKRVETAQFDVHTRVLTLPTWDRASNTVYDALVAHEVGHALYTPDRDWRKEVSIPQSFVNIVEDARVEKLMKRRYAGLAKTFHRGYNELHEQDFFQIEDEDITEFNLADRANLYYKIGSWIQVSFSTSEKQIINLINDCETFDETLSAAEALYNFCKQEHEERKGTEQGSEEDTEFTMDINNSISSDNNSSLPDSDSSDSMESGSNSDVSDTSNDNRGGTLGGKIETRTDESLTESLKDLVNTGDTTSSEYFELPKLDLKNIIIPNGLIHQRISEDFRDQQKIWDESDHVFLQNLFEEVDSDYLKFKRDAQKEVNYLVKEFECRKSASAYARSTTSRTGVLDTSRLHSYKYNEDLFKKINVVPDGKNHGLIFILDWSGSMNHVMMDTIKQLYNLLWFCKKVNIPFEVYAFTNCYPPTQNTYHEYAYEKKEGVALIEETFSLMNLFTSKVKNKDLDIQMKNIFRIACAFNHSFYCPFNVPLGMNLSGTPLNESLVCLHQIIPQFQKNNGVEKVQCVILTDGEAHPLRYSKIFKRHWESDDYMGSNYVNDRCILRNRKTGHTYSCLGLGHWAQVTDLMLRDLRETFPNTNFIGIRVLGNRDASEFAHRYAGYGDEYDNVMKKWRREKTFSIKTSGYHTYFGLSSNALANDDEFEVKEDATKAEIKRAFTKSLKGKKMNKKVLGEFIELVA